MLLRRFLPSARRLTRTLLRAGMSSSNFESSLQNTLRISSVQRNNFAEIPFGEIPEVLKHDRPLQTGQLDNGVMVCTEHWPSPLTTVAVFINCGSRHETLENSGVAHFLEHLHFKGSKKRTRDRLELDVENMGGQLNAYTSRENTSYTMTVFKNKAHHAVEILGDMLTNSIYDQGLLDQERGTIYRECLETQKDQMETTVENIHFTSFRKHQMGQPILGKLENIRGITRNQILEYHATHYVGPNIVVVGVGDIDHQQLVKMVSDSFGKLPSKGPDGLKVQNLDKPEFTPSMMLLAQDSPTFNVGVFYEAPSWLDEDYYSFLVFQRILGDYSQEKVLNEGHKLSELHHMHANLINFPDVYMQRSIYAPYSDVGLFGSHFVGGDNNIFEMLNITQAVLEDYAGHVSKSELFRARNKLWMELCLHETGNDISQSIGNQMLYLKRRVPRSEIAKRVSHITAEHLQKVAAKWFLEKDISTVGWGNLALMPEFINSNRQIRRSPSGW